MSKSILRVYSNVFLLIILVFNKPLFAQEYSYSSTVNIQFTTMDILNSPYRETNPCLTPDGKFLFFMSGRGGMSWSDPEYTVYKGKKEADGEIYITVKI